jgi:hypothetical protein
MIEREIIIGLITSTEYCSSIKPVWNDLYIESPTGKRLSSWCWEYFEEYQKAPKRNIEKIYFAKLKEGKQNKDLFAEIEEEILPGLSKEYENSDFNLERLVKKTNEYFSTRHLKIHSETIQALTEAGKIEDAEKLAADFKPLSIISTSLDSFIVSAFQIREKKRNPPKVLLSPWLREGETTILYANYGVGKSLLAIHIAYVLGLHEYDSKKSEIGEWQVKTPTGCLYIDGELGELEMEERIRGFEWLGPQSNKHKMKVLAIPEYQLATEDSFYLSERKNQLKLIKWLQEHPTYKLIVLDSASTLFGLVEENDNSEWSAKVNPFLRDLRALGVHCLLLHHAGKDNKRGLRGASAMGAMASFIFRLYNHEDKDIDEGEAWFVLTKDKQRAKGFTFKPFGLHYSQEDNNSETHWEDTGTKRDN